MHHRFLPVLGLLVVLASACVGAPPLTPDAAESEPPATGMRLGVIQSIADGCKVRCRDPSAAVGPMGEVYVTPISGDWIQRSLDGGRSFERLPPPPPPPSDVLMQPGPQPPVEPRSLPAPAQEAYESMLLTDAHVAVDDQGRLYFVAVRNYRQGFHIAASDDQGKTWTQNTYWSGVTDPAVPVIGWERPALTFGLNDTVHLSYDSIGYGPVVVSWNRATPDRPSWSLALPVTAWGRPTVSGEGVAHAGGSQYLVFRFEGPSVLSRTVWMARATPKAFWSVSAIHSAPSPAIIVERPLVSATDRLVVAAWVEDRGGSLQLWMVKSNDAGATWQQPTRCDSEERRYTAGLQLRATNETIYHWYVGRTSEGLELLAGEHREPSEPPCTPTSSSVLTRDLVATRLSADTKTDSGFVVAWATTARLDVGVGTVR